MTKTKMTILVFVAMVATIYGLKGFALRVNKQKYFGSQQSKAKGNPQADVHIVEYTDFQCPACASGAQVIKNYFQQHPDNIYLEFRHFPIHQIHNHALRAAAYAECASQQGAFWPMQDRLFAQQRNWSKSADAEPIFETMALATGLNTQMLQSCLADAVATEQVIKERANGKFLGVNATPTYFINEKMVVGPRNLMIELERIFPKP